jgi:hypothetical protein
MGDDVAEDALIDVSGLSLQDLLDNVSESALALTLDRILTPGQDAGHYGFNNSI